MEKNKTPMRSSSQTQEKQLNIDDFYERSAMDHKDEWKEKPQLLLHSCCGPCSTVAIERLIRNYHVTLYFYNPNIWDDEEYEKRRDAQVALINKYNNSLGSIDSVEIIEGAYEKQLFQKLSRGLENEPEGGERCIKCFILRLEKTAEVALFNGFEYYTTTLTVSPHKNSKTVIRVGEEIGIRYGLTFVAEDFKKMAGYERTIELSRKYQVYRQNYCGCKYSIPKKENEKNEEMEKLDL